MNRFLALAKIGVVLVGATVGCVSLSAAGDTSDAASEVGNAVVKNWVTPAYPAELEAAKVQGELKANFVINSDGTVRELHIAESDDHRLDDSLLTAIRASTFTPAIEQGHAVAQGVQLIWDFRLPYRPSTFVEVKPLPRTSAVAYNQPAPEYPTDMLPRRLDGEVLCEVQVNPEGFVSGVTVQGVTDADFLPAALEAIHNTRFKPAKQGDLPVSDRKIAPLTFLYDQSLASDKRSVLEVNGISVDPAPDGSVLPSDPQPIVLPQPIYPMADLLAGRGGDAEVSFKLNAQGSPESITLVSASLPSFGSSLIAATEFSIFKPALHDGKVVEVALHRKYHFEVPPDTAEANETNETRVRRQLRSGQSVASAKGLDLPLRPIWRISPGYPVSAIARGSPSGKAEIEIIIDEQGRVRVPRIISSSSDEFGYAAATSLSQWVFDPPVRNGQPAEVRARVPVVFTPKGKPSS